MSEKYIKIKDEGRGITRLTLDRADKLNALDLAVLDELCASFAALDDDDRVRVIILDSAGPKAFIAGADIAQMSEMGPLQFRDYTLSLRKLARLMTGGEKAIIGAVRGVAFGGGNIVAMNCDFVFATEQSRFGQQEISLGILGGVPRLIHLVGARRAWDLVMTGRVIGAAEAEAIGLITKCLPDDEFDDYVMEYARGIASQPATAVRLAKVLKRVSERVDLETAYEYENELISLCFDAEDTKRLMTDFVQRTKK